MNKKNICFITTTRAEFGLLEPLINETLKNDKYTISLVVSGTHLSKKFGETYKEIGSKFEITSKIDIIDDEYKGEDEIFNIISDVNKKFPNELRKINNVNKIDLIIILGDRFEILAISQVAFIIGLNICHLAGGDITKGVMDDEFRNSITQISNYHMPFSEESKLNLIKMNINDKYIYTIGNPGLEILKNFVPNKTKQQVIEYLGIKTKYILCIFHPETKNNNNYVNIFFDKVTDFLKNNKNYSIIIIKTNCDPGYVEILNKISVLNNNNKFSNNIKLVDNLNRYDYLTIAYYSDFYIGNSSSGLYELPYLKIPIINVGNRQLGRHLSSNIISTDFNEISQNLEYVKNNRTGIVSNITFGYKIYDSKEIFIKSLDTIFFS
jgi:UDP-N-acetylglucosamine 2-epimerase (non-hydrolysing)